MADEKVYKEELIEKKAPKLFFQWRVNAFIPYLSSDNASAVERVREEFDARFLAKAPEKYIEEYRCVPEYLLDMGWAVAMENAARKDIRILAEKVQASQKTSFDTLMESEGHIYFIERKIMLWIRQGMIKLEKINGGPNTFNKDEWETEANKCKELLQLNGVYRPGDSSAIKDMATKVDQIEQKDTRRNDLKDLAKQLSDMEPMDIERLLKSNSQLIPDFCSKLLDFIDNPIWRKTGENKGLVKLWKEIVSVQEKMLKCGYLTAEEYALYREKIEGFQKIKNSLEGIVGNLWDAVQHTMNMISDMYENFASHSTKAGTVDDTFDREKLFFTKLEELDKLIEIQTKAMGISVNSKMLEGYKKDASRCTAILSDRTKSYIAFSGFLDTEDADILKFLGYSRNDEILTAFQNISSQMGASLVTMETGIGAELYWYSIGKKLDFVCGNNLQCELDEWIKTGGGSVGKFQHPYTCCERKLLAYVKRHAVRMADDIQLIVKFMPCMHCHAALLSWNRKDDLMVWYPELP